MTFYENTILAGLIRDKKLTYLSCLLAVAIVPVYVFYLPPVMILWGLSWLVENNFRFTREMFKDNRAAWLLVIFLALFLWQATGLVRAGSLSYGFERMFKRLSFLLFPLVLFFPSDLIKNRINPVLQTFAVFTLVYIIFCLGNAFHNSLIIQNGAWKFNPHPADFTYENFFTGNRLSALMHPSYLAMYVLMALLISLESILNICRKKIWKIFWIFASMIFLVVSYLLSSRAGFMAFCIVIPGFLFFRFYKRMSGFVSVFLIIIISTLMILLLLQNERIKYSRDGVTKEEINTVLKNDVRYPIWKSAFEVIKRNVITGVGTGNASDELKKEFLREGYSEGFYPDLNSHNQFIEILLENGIIGLCIFLVMIGYMMYMAVTGRNLLYGLFIMMMLIFFFFETMLNRIAGVTFFSLFAFLLIYKSNVTENDSK